MKSFFVAAPGKVILFGEHAVVHEKVCLCVSRLTRQAAIATSVSLCSYLLVQVTPLAEDGVPHVTINFPDIGLNHSWPISSLPCLPHVTPVAPASLNEGLVKSLDTVLDAFAKSEFQHTAIFAFLYLYVSLSKPMNGNISFLLRSAIPIGSGLGSSASISVCLATALLILGEYISPPSDVHPGHETLNLINGWAFLGERCIHGNPSGVDNTVATFGGGVLYRKERRQRQLSNGTFTPSKPAERVIIK